MYKGKGGYQMVNLGDVNLTSDPVSVPGVYEAIEGNYRKPIMLSGLMLNGSEKADAYAVFTGTDSNYVTTIYGGTLTITNGDMCSFT